MSPKRRNQLAERKQVREQVLERDGGCVFWDRAWCSAGWLPGDLVGAPTRCTDTLEVHEVIPRSAWAAGWLVPDNCVTLCGGPNGHHAWVTDHPAEAHRLGLHGFSWERKA
jgi:5-methylcytosine-specific restriction endonuclease McrA